MVPLKFNLTTPHKYKANRRGCKNLYKNRQSITACSLLHLLLPRISYLTTLGPKMSLSNITVKYSEENPISGFQRSGNIGSKSVEFAESSDSIVTLTRSLIYSEGQHGSLLKQQKRRQHDHEKRLQGVWLARNLARVFVLQKTSPKLQREFLDSFKMGYLSSV